MRDIEICGFTIDRDENAAQNLKYLSTPLDSKHLSGSTIRVYYQGLPNRVYYQGYYQGLPEVLREVTPVEISLAAEPANELWRDLRGLRVMCH